MASLRVRERVDGTKAYAVLFREGGAQTSETFDDARQAEMFRQYVDTLGAQAALDILNARERAASSVTLEQWCERHIEQLTGVTEGTRHRYRSMVARDLGALGPLPVEAVTPGSIAKWINAQDAGGAAAKTIANRHGFLYAAMEGAIRAGLIAANPCKGTRLPDSTRREMVFLTDSEFAVLLGYIRPDAQDLVIALVGTGHRFGEETALQARDWDSQNQRITVSRAWKYSGVSSRPTLGPPKTTRSKRSHRVAPEIAEIYDRLTRGKQPEDFIFTNAVGQPWRASNFHSAVWQPAVACANGEDWQAKRAEWEPSRGHTVGGHRKPWRTPATTPLGKRPRVHDLRHTFVSWQLQGGASILAVSRRLGHESIKTTVDVYGHLSPADDDAVNATVSRGLGSALPQIVASPVAFVTSRAD